ncbi:transmembrane protein 273 isoform X3 [Artibeus jamaicensis]|uniref:transmembrane protein 273 isoform X3 n=1 Tax=Artibeus jamaicensis TaxID=9417 RepID=UPI00235AFB69|nr:transmembrane protein 273 isoform X3 [Artibeus jamaicensis]
MGRTLNPARSSAKKQRQTDMVLEELKCWQWASQLRLKLVDIKYAIIGIALGVAILAGFLALKICMIKKHLFDIDSSDLRFNDTIALKKTAPRDAQMFEL